MVTITDTAGSLLQQVQADQEGRLLRVETDAAGLVIGTSAPRTDDQVLFHDGQPVLRLSPEAATALAGCTIDTQETAEGAQLTIVPPAAQ